MDLNIYTGKADYNTSPFGNQKDVVIVEFPNCISKTTNKPFKWLPTYDQLLKLKDALDKIEEKSWENDIKSEKFFKRSKGGKI